MFKGILIKIKFTIFFLKSVIGSKKGKQKILKDLDTASKNQQFPMCNSEVEFTKKPFIDRNSLAELSSQANWK